MNQLKKRFTDIFLSLLLAIVVIFGYHSEKAQKQNTTPETVIEKQAETLFGFNLDSVYVEKNTIARNDVFGGILTSLGVSANAVMLLEHESKDVFNMRNIRAGASYHVVKADECASSPLAVIYEPDIYSYIIYDVSSDQPKVEKLEKEVTYCEDYVEGSIEGSLWKALENLGISASMIDQMEEALSSSVDFYHARKGDEFKLLFEKKYVEGKYAGMGRLLAANYINQQGSHYSLLYKNGDIEGYYDTEGRPAKKAFLRAPVKFSRISSSYNLRRFHPVKKKVIAHLGTDYAAPYGTPIHSVADGVVEVAGYTSNNGYYVKIRHNKVYQTQYLHMSRFAKGIKSGTKVKQGETIGYVGATGLATGPHVCFRFWKNGRQVNHLREKLPAAKPMKASALPEFIQHRDAMLDKLEDMSLFYRKTRISHSNLAGDIVP